MIASCWGGKLVTIYAPLEKTEDKHTILFWGTYPKPKGYSQPNTPIKWSQKVAVVWTHDDIIKSGGGVDITTSSRHHHGNLCRIPAHAHIGAIMLETLESTPPSPTTGAGAQKPMVRPSPEKDAARRRARQSMREYELIWLLQQRLRAVSWPHCWRLRCMQPAATAHCTATAWELSDLDHSHAAIPQRVTRASCAQLLRSVLGAACR